MNQIDKVRGSLLGTHAGDCLGAGVEFMSQGKIKSLYPNGVQEITGGGPFGFKKGEPTDDTTLMLCLARAYDLTSGGSHLVYEAADLMVEWFRGDPKDIGNTTRVALQTYAKSQDPFTSGATDQWSAANGSLMRCMPTGLARRRGETLMVESQKLSAITHALSLCQDSCAAYNWILSGLIDGLSAEEAFDDALSNCENEDVISSMQKARECEDIDDLPQPRGGYVLHGLSCAIWALFHSIDLESGLIQVVSLGEDTDTNGAIAGGLLGAYHGVDAIPTRWMKTLMAAPELDSLAEVLLEIRNEK